MHYIYGGCVLLLMDWVTFFSIISCLLMKISFDQPFWIVTYFFFLFLFVWVVMPIHFEEYHGSSIRHRQRCSNTYCILLIHIVVHTYLVMILHFIPKYPLVIQLLWHIHTHFNRYSLYYAALTSLIAHLSSFHVHNWVSQLIVPHADFRWLTLFLKLMHPLSPLQMITITIAFLILIGIVAKLVSKMVAIRVRSMLKWKMTSATRLSHCATVFLGILKILTNSTELIQPYLG